MTPKFIETRIQMKRDTAAAWAEVAEFKPLEGEYIFYTDLNKVKIGKKDANGNLIPLRELPFLDARDADTLDGKHASDFVLKTDAAPVDAEKNVQSDWNEANTTSDAYIKNKPNVVLEGDARLTDARTPKAHNQAATTITEDTTHRFVTDEEKSIWNVKSNFSGSYNDLTNKPTIPTVPTKISAFMNDAGYLTSYTETDQTVPSHVKSITANDITNWNNKSTFDGNYNSLSNKPTIPTVNNATLTIQKNGAMVNTFTANSATNVTANITVPTKVSELTNDSGFKTTDTNTTYDLVAPASKTNGNVTINLTAGGSGSGTDSVQIKGSGATTVTTDTSGIITISSTDTNTETTLAVTDKTNTDTTDLVYAITNLVEGGTKGHTITPTYTGLPTKAYVDKMVTGTVEYLGTVSGTSGLSTTAGKGDFYRVSTAFTFGSETAHVGDMLLATKDNPTQNATDWDLIHTEVDSNTWVENKVNAAGYVTAPGTSNANKVWKTDGSGNPGWRDDTNTDTGATSVEATGTGNAVTTATYNASTRKLTLTKGATYVTKTEIDTLISSGTADPSVSTASQYYFKYN